MKAWRTAFLALSFTASADQTLWNWRVFQKRAREIQAGGKEAMRRRRRTDARARALAVARARALAEVPCHTIVKAYLGYMCTE